MTSREFCLVGMRVTLRVTFPSATYCCFSTVSFEAHREFRGPPRSYTSCLPQRFIFLTTSPMFLLVFTSLSKFPSLLSPPPTPPPVLFRKGPAPYGYQPDIVYQVAVRLGTFPCIQAGQNNSLGRKRFLKQASESETAPAPAVGIPQEDHATQL